MAVNLFQLFVNSVTVLVKKCEYNFLLTGGFDQFVIKPEPEDKLNGS